MLKNRLMFRPSFPVLILVLLAVFGCSAPPDSPADLADLILTHGKVYTFKWSDPAVDGTPATEAPHGSEGTHAWRPDAEAVAMKGGRIVFVGSSAEVAKFRGEATRVIDLRGATVVPGLVDSHTHVAGLGANLERVDLTAAAGEEEAVELAAARAAEVPAGDWIVGWGWDEGAWAEHYPDMKQLSERVPDHPVVMESLHGFAVWGNRRAFDQAGITRHTEPPVGGEIVRDASGEPTGLLLNRATTLLTSVVPPPTPEQLEGHVLAGLEEMARSGFVAVHEAGVGSDLMAAFESLHAAGRLPVRVYAMISARDEPLMRAWLERGPEPANAGKLVRRSVKAYYDGALGSRGARLLEDYSDQPGHRGVSGDQYGFDQDLVAEMIRAGFQTGIHAIGDAGNRETLDFLQSVYAAPATARNGRHRIEHAQVVHADDFARFATMGIIASMQPPHAVEDKTWAEDRLGAERILGAYAWRTFRRQGVPLIFNSDLTGSDHSIFYGLHAAITRRDKEHQPDGGWYSAQVLSAEEALRAYAVWPAYAAFVEDETGILEPGRWADLTVLDMDPLNMAESDPDRLLDGQVLLTVVAGQIVHENFQ